MKSADKSTTSPVPLDTKSTIAELRARCPLPVLMKRMGQGKYAQKSCRSPFRTDKKPSWGVFQRNDRWFWNDFATGDKGDEIEFIARHQKLDLHKEFFEALAYWEKLAKKGPATPDEIPAAEPRCKPNASGFGPGTDNQLDQLVKLRNIDARGLLVAQDRGVLVFGRFIGHDVYGVTDASGNVLEVRRLDGRPFPAHGDLAERKSHAIKGSRKNWPVGIANTGDRPAVVLVEGLPDFLAAFEVVVAECALDRVAPVAMLSAASQIGSAALPQFKGRHVRIIPHEDDPGRKAAMNWKRQLLDAGASKVDFVALTGSAGGDCSPIKDLNDYLPLYRIELASGLAEGRLL